MLTPRSICQPITIGDSAVQKTMAAAPSDLIAPRCLLPYISDQKGATTVD